MMFVCIPTALDLFWVGKNLEPIPGCCGEITGKYFERKNKM
jgi:hypothetical protein